MKSFVWAGAGLAAAGLVLGAVIGAMAAGTDAVPSEAPAKPAKPRQLLVFTLTKGWAAHESTPIIVETLKALGEKTGAYTATTGDDINLLRAAGLAKFDAVLMVNTQGDFLTDPEMRQGLVDYVKSGHGLVAIHAAADANSTWPEWPELIGGTYNGHPWNRASVKIDDPASPLNAWCGGKGFLINDEVYTFRAPYSRDKLHILLSMDWKMAQLGNGNRADNDFALAWIHEYGKGRVFYSAFGHDPKVCENPLITAHWLAGIQYALGDLAADATPTSKLNPPPTPIPSPPFGTPQPPTAPTKRQ
jgi:type 1 glutamine amidotransferase